MSDNELKIIDVVEDDDDKPSWLTKSLPRRALAAGSPGVNPSGADETPEQPQAAGSSTIHNAEPVFTEPVNEPPRRTAAATPIFSDTSTPDPDHASSASQDKVFDKTRRAASQDTRTAPKARPGKEKENRKWVITDLFKWSKPSAPSEEDQPQPPKKAPILWADQDHSCIIMGPSNSGKTFLLLAIAQACAKGGGDGIDLAFVPIAPKDPKDPKPPSIGLLMKRSVEIITGKDENREGTGFQADYPFEITAKAYSGNWIRKKFHSATIQATVSDGPGGALFKDEANQKFSSEEIEKWYKMLIPKAREARSIIFCVDATEPKLAILLKNLPILIQDMTLEMEEDQTAPYEQSLFEQMSDPFARREPSKERVTRRRLNADRFLLLLTKVDRLCANSGRKERPATLASMIEPVGQAKETLTVDLLERIRQVLKPEAKFAVGMVSALGFHPENGLPLANEKGFVRKVDQIETEDEILRAWTPVGVREAMLFMATGHAVGNIRLVDHDDLLSDHQEPYQ